MRLMEGEILVVTELTKHKARGDILEGMK